VEGGLNIGVQNGIRRQLKVRGPVWGPTGPFFQIEDSRHWPALQAPIQESRDHLMAPKCHSRLIQGLRKAATETRLVTLEQGTQWKIIVY